jgi:excisionase family DNA binding protein
VTDAMNASHLRTSPCDRLAYSVDEACRLLSIGRTSLYELAKRDELRLIKIAGRTLVPRSELERLAGPETAR